MQLYIPAAALLAAASGAVFLLLQSLFGIAAVMGLIGLVLWAVGRFAGKRGLERPQENEDEKHDKQA